MAPVYADHPFPLVPTPIGQLARGAKPDIFDECGSEMALVHNIMVRGLNSIYLQAPHIAPRDEKAFVQYALQWCRLLHLHHSGEEEEFFPAIEALTGQEGIMEVNVQQHEAFHAGFEAFAGYLEDCRAGRQRYDGARVVAMIDAFGPALTQHLAEEIPSMVGLRQFGDRLKDILKLMSHEAEKNMKALGPVAGMPFAFANLDARFENGIWSGFPPAPGVVKFVIFYITWWAHADWWKFGSCDWNGNMRPLYAVPEDKSS